MKYILTLLLSFLWFNGFSQTKFEPGIYITENKLGYITILDSENFEYLEYDKFSPLTVKEQREKEGNKPRFCGTIGYVLHDKGKGSYLIVDSKLILNFDKEIKSMMTNENPVKQLSLEISKLITE